MKYFHRGLLVFVGLSYIAAGIPHFTHPEFYAPMMPNYLPYHSELVFLSGIFEVLGGIGMLIPQMRRFTAIGLIALLCAVFPANIHIVVNEVPILDRPIDPVMMWGRLPLQAVFIYMVWWTGLKKHPWDNPSQ